MKLSDNIKFIRKNNNLSQEQLAEQLGVSRQAVSKWESDQSYPEMDKVLLICKLYNYNIDELMNENIKEVSETKQSKININKYIDDFFAFITKTVNMLSSMKIKERLRCFIEQVVIAIFLVAVFAVIGIIGSVILENLIEIIPYNIYYTIIKIVTLIYMVLAFIIGVTVLLHIFKIRYLDYYEIVKEENDEKLEDSQLLELNKEDNKKIFLKKDKEKLVIRDPDHSQSKFLTGIIKVVLWCIKIIAVFVGIGIASSFVVLVTLTVLSFLFVKTGLIFLGVLLGLISALVINFVILKLIYNFIISKKNHKKQIEILLISALILAGLSIGIGFIGAISFNVIEDNNYELEEEYNINMTDNLVIESWDGSIEYVENDSEQLRITVKHSKYNNTSLVNENEIVYIFSQMNDSNFMNVIRDVIDDLNNKTIRNYNYNNKITVHTSKTNIEKLKQNKLKQYEELRENEKLQDKILELEYKILEQEASLEEQRLSIEEKNNEIQRLQKDLSE